MILVNVATVSPPSTVHDPELANNDAGDVNLFVPRANLVLAKTATPSFYVPGEALTFTIDVTDDGPGSAIGARVRDPLNGALAGFTWTCVGIQRWCDLRHAVGHRRD